MYWIFLFILALFLVMFFLFPAKSNQKEVISLKKGVFPLSELPQGYIAQIESLTDRLQGATRNRLLDLGFVEGSLVSVYLNSPMNDPKAYHIHNTIIALRSDQSQHILVKIVQK